jgi:hypothetical protein
MNRLKKHRGLKRYYQNLSVKNDLKNIDWLNFNSIESWPKNWHMHFDSWGYGNNSFAKRKPHLDKLFRHFDALVEKTKDLEADFQLYAVLLDYASSSDALFLHPQTPHNSQFSFKISDLQTTTTLTNQPLNNYLNELTGYDKLYGQAKESFCLIYSPNSRSKNFLT